MSTNNTRPSEYLSYLPAIFRKQTAAKAASFLGQYLKAFEALLSGRPDAQVSGREGRTLGLEERIRAYEAYLDPGLMPMDDKGSGRPKAEFLDYLASWVALTFDQNWELDKRRQWLRRIVSLYKKRGTKAGLVEYLNTFVGNQVTVDEPIGRFIVGVQNCTVGVDTYVGEAWPYFFWVRIHYGYVLGEFKIDEWKILRKGTRAIVDLEKPAHTYYRLDARTPGIVVGGLNSTETKLGPGATVGIDTLIWEQSLRV